jgi:hypothetical protein
MPAPVRLRIMQNLELLTGVFEIPFLVIGKSEVEENLVLVLLGGQQGTV